MKRRRNNVLWIILISLVALIGGSGLATLIYLAAEGELEALTQGFFAYILYGADSVLIMFWGFVLPLVLIAFAVFTIVRRRKEKDFRWKYERAVDQAIEAERADFAARQDKNSDGRFSPLKKGDDVADEDGVKDLRQLCDAFRNFAAANLGLYFSIEDIREFVASMGTSRLLILQGISGSGKTSLAYAFGEFIGNSSTIVPVQPMWKERADLLGYYNEFTRHFNETTLFRKLYEANFGNKIYITVLDEMNIARIEYYFAEFLSLMELPDPELRTLEVVSDSREGDPEGIRDGCIRLPSNMWFVGTVNNDDSAYVISDKVYDRAMVVELGDKAQPFAADGTQHTVAMSVDCFDKMVSKACMRRMSDEVVNGLRILDEFLIDNFQLTFGNRIRRQISDYVAIYVACGGKETSALDVIFAKKVLRKLQYKDLSRYNDELERLDSLLDATFGNGVMAQCKRYLNEARHQL